MWTKTLRWNVVVVVVVCDRKKASIKREDKKQSFSWFFLLLAKNSGYEKRFWRAKNMPKKCANTISYPTIVGCSRDDEEKDDEDDGDD